MKTQSYLIFLSFLSRSDALPPPTNPDIGNLLFNTTFPKGQDPDTKILKIIGPREDEPLPSGETNMVSSFLKYWGNTCQLGLWDGGDDNGANPGQAQWQGEPLSNGVAQWQCINIGDLNSGLAPNKASSFQLTGYCECEFLDERDCAPGNGYLAYNRQDGDVDGHGSHPSSFRCRDKLHDEEFESCDVQLFSDTRGTEVKSFSYGREYFTETVLADLAPAATQCQNITVDQTPVAVSQWNIKGCSCVFYNNTNCDGDINSIGGLTKFDFNGGNAGREVYYNYPNMIVQSYKCWLPFGVAYNL
ncbi:hypothetical protein TWF694_001491 [Orbilia ellipsospora]|uniref:Uncharacterized protein n=1 Tax=Orbilia ellipsospora TaxID=2528407 RepID=A0AAV9XRU9_9PEZI